MSSPCAPAQGWMVAASIPQISASALSSRAQSSRVPWERASGDSGWSPAKPGNPAVNSLSLGLYFMVQLPSG